MRQQHLVERASPADLVAVVDRLLGLHAQLMSSVDLALWARIDGLEREAVAEALWRKRTLVKIWAMRSTLHVLPAADLGTWIAGLGIWKPGTWPLKDPEAIPLASYIDKALRGKILTRTELVAAVTKLGATRKMAEGLLGSWGGSLKPASYFGYLCCAPNHGQQVRFTHPATWLRKPPKQTDSNRHSTSSLRPISARTVLPPRPTLGGGGVSTKLRRNAGWLPWAPWQRKSRSRASGIGC